MHLLKSGNEKFLETSSWYICRTTSRLLCIGDLTRLRLGDFFGEVVRRGSLSPPLAKAFALKKRQRRWTYARSLGERAKKRSSLRSLLRAQIWVAFPPQPLIGKWANYGSLRRIYV